MSDKAYKKGGRIEYRVYSSDTEFAPGTYITERHNGRYHAVKSKNNIVILVLPANIRPAKDMVEL